MTSKEIAQAIRNREKALKKRDKVLKELNKRLLIALIREENYRLVEVYYYAI